MMHKRAAFAVGIVTAAAVFSTVAVAIQTTVKRRISGEIDRMVGSGIDRPVTMLAEGDLAGLPEPVQRWIGASGAVGKPRPVTVRLKQSGTFRLGPDKAWMPFVADEYYTTDPPGYLWRTTMQMAPFLTIDGQDRYVDGDASIEMRLLSIVPVAQSSGGELNQGAMLRYLNEIMWFPAAAISPYISWIAIDASSAQATMIYGGVTASATFMFDAQGRLTNMVANRNNSATHSMEPWSTPIDAYGEFDGMHLPSSGSAIWNYASGDFAYIRLRISEVQVNRPERYQTAD